LVLAKIRRRFPSLKLIGADGGYNALQVEAAVAKMPVLRMEIVKRSNEAAERTTIRIGSPSVSTKAWILRPFTFLPAMNPAMLLRPHRRPPSR
jgi:hypothetical protein